MMIDRLLDDIIWRCVRKRAYVLTLVSWGPVQVIAMPTSRFYFVVLRDPRKIEFVSRTKLHAFNQCWSDRLLYATIFKSGLDISRIKIRHLKGENT